MPFASTLRRPLARSRQATASLHPRRTSPSRRGPSPSSRTRRRAIACSSCNRVRGRRLPGERPGHRQRHAGNRGGPVQGEERPVPVRGRTGDDLDERHRRLRPGDRASPHGETNGREPPRGRKGDAERDPRPVTGTPAAHHRRSTLGEPVGECRPRLLRHRRGEVDLPGEAEPGPVVLGETAMDVRTHRKVDSLPEGVVANPTRRVIPAGSPPAVSPSYTRST
jgi:hypothetical protein